MTFCLIRHGKTPGNLRGAFVGSENQPVAPEGLQELRELAARGVYPPVEAVFSSPMSRCVETAALLFPDREIPVIEDLRERSFGLFEGKTHREIIALPGWEGWGMDEMSMEFPQGEEQQPFYDRCVAGFLEAARRCREKGVNRAAVVTHGGVIMALMFLLVEDPALPYHQWACGNGLGYRVEWDWEARKLTLLGKLGE